MRTGATNRAMDKLKFGLADGRAGFPGGPPASAVAATVGSARPWAQVAGAHGDVRVVAIGLNGRGPNHRQSVRNVISDF